MDIISFPLLISKEGKWFVASCPMLDIATQGTTEEEVKGNMVDLIEEYMEDQDTQKPDLETIMSTSVTMISVPVKIRGVYRDTKALHEVNNMEDIYKLGEGN
jgi:predicted RNase H-like HicB family nuclease